jgi:PAS domain S-box-containing protein
VLTEAEYRTIVEQAPIMIWRAKTDARCDYFNERWLSFTGRTLQDELGDGWSNGVHPDDRERCLKIYKHSFNRREPFEIEYRLRRYDGEYRWVLDTGAPIHDEFGAFSGFVGSCVDVTDRVEARATLARATLRDLGLSN